MSEYTIYPAVDSEYNFPPQIRQAIAAAPEFKSFIEGYLNANYAEKSIQEIVENGRLSATAIAELIDSRTPYINVLDRGVVGDGVADDTAAVQLLLDFAPKGKILWAPPGTKIKTRGWNIIGKDLRVDFSNVHLIKSDINPIFTVSGEWEPAMEVSSHSGTQITVPAGHNLQPGELVKMISNDGIWDARPQDRTDSGVQAKQGEFFIVKTTPTIANATLDPQPLDQYTTDIRLWRPIEHVCEIKFGTAEDLGPEGPEFQNPMFQLRGLIRPKISGRVIRGVSIALGLKGCYGAEVDLDVDGLPFSDGYGVACGGSAYSNIKIRANRTRHAFTDNPGGYGSETFNPNEYGRSMYNKITGIVHSGQTTAFDCHHGSYGNKFYDCIVVGMAETNGSAYVLRGQHHELVNCSAHSVDYGFRFYSEEASEWATSFGHVLQDCVTNNVKGAIVSSVGIRRITYGPTATISGGRYEFGNGGFIMSDRSRLILNGVTAIFTGAGFTGGEGIIKGTSHDIIGDLILDMSTLTGGTAGIYTQTDGSSEGTVCELKVLVIGNSGLSGFNYVAVPVRASGFIDVEVDGGDFGGAGLGSNYRNMLYRYRARNGGTKSSVFGSTTRNTEGGYTPGYSVDPIVVDVIGTTTGTIPIGAWEEGRYLGQTVTLVNAATVTRTLVVRHGSTYKTDIPGGANLSLLNGESATFFWQGQAWRCINIAKKPA